ncbi:KRAB-A domain-containing protein 2-like [Photinus pyralis]|uniref:KRAB-A domain-containing protein 2-like n=1 Tax=Photinus pyralis TaxID=7054 RepID=UPI00126762C7|nr:KRAB-A domain-containing protein 2-like [Photinus pyralis]
MVMNIQLKNRFLDMDQSLRDINNRFNFRLTELISAKGRNTQIFNKKAYLEMIQSVKSSKNKQTSKLPEDYQRLGRYDVVTIGAIEKLIVPVKEGNLMRYYAHTEEIFQILHDTHVSIGHGGRNRMEKELNLKYKNITREMIVIYLNLCESCQKKQKVPKKGLVVKPILSKDMNSRCQVDLIDMQSQEDEGYKFILVYQDHLTKFVQLRPLKTKRAEEVAYVLLDIFTIFGAPSILQSDNGREFANCVITELCDMWQELKMVHGKPRHSQSQGSVERCNQDVENMLSSWLTTNKSKKWSEGLRFVQLMKNRAHHSGINCSPYEAMFGVKLKVGLKSFVPDDALTNLNTEEDLETLSEARDTTTPDVERNAFEEDLKTHPETSDTAIAVLDRNASKEDSEMEALFETSDTSTPVIDRNVPEKTTTPSTSSLRNIEHKDIDVNSELTLDKGDEITISPQISEKIENTRKTRNMAWNNLKKQATKMINTSNSKFPAANIGETVRVRVPDVDRSRSDERNMVY